jgi:hypothetical protein
MIMHFERSKRSVTSEFKISWACSPQNFHRDFSRRGGEVGANSCRARPESACCSFHPGREFDAHIPAAASEEGRIGQAEASGVGQQRARGGIARLGTSREGRQREMVGIIEKMKEKTSGPTPNGRCPLPKLQTILLVHGAKFISVRT